jgi:UDP-2,3-diacylglucosamine pyrophosphatase LpxH
MKFSFDLISDLHIGPHESFNWEGQATSTMCIVAGDISRDIEIVRDTLEHLAQCYQAVFYIDGNNEHRYNIDSISDSYQMLTGVVSNIKNVVFLQNNCVVINGVAILGTNGWWTWDFDPYIDEDQSRHWYCDAVNANRYTADEIYRLAYDDTAYLINSVKKLQKHPDVKSIVIVTHTVPAVDLINHDAELASTYKLNTMGNSNMSYVLDEDTENKIKTWCFGHYHNDVDRTMNSIRYVNNCRGHAANTAYYPKRIVINI